MSFNGGKKISWNKQVELRKKELSKLKNSNSFIPYKKLSKSKDNNIFMIHDNGNIPFIVVSNNKGLYIYLSKTNKLLLKITKFLGYWYGFDSSPYEIHGNSILIQIAKKKYLYIGSEIYKFDTSDIIQDYISPLGNSDVPYPVAYGSEYVYFMLDKKYIMNNEILIQPTVANSMDIYSEFYGHINFVKKRVIKQIKYVIIQERL